MLLRSLVTCNLIVEEVGTVGTCAYVYILVSTFYRYLYTIFLVDNNMYV